MAVDAGPAVSDFIGLLFRGRSDAGSDLSELDPEFAPYYHNHVKSLVDEYEKKRLVAVGQARFWGWIAVAANIAVYAFAYYLKARGGFEFFNLGTVILMFLGLGLIYYAYMPVMSFKGHIKGQLYPLIFRFFGSDFSYHASSRLSAKSLRASDIVPIFDDEKNEDYVRGTYKGVTLELMESVLTKEERVQRQGKTERRTEEVFRGLFIVFGMHKSFQGKTVVRRDFGRIGNWLMDKTSSLETVHLEDPVFEKAFQVMSTNQIEARYLLTTSFMERLLQVDDIFRQGEFLAGGRLQCSFYNDRLLVSIPSRQDRFEVGAVFRPMTFVNEINEILKQMRLIFAIVDTLKLDETTGL